MKNTIIITFLLAIALSVLGCKTSNLKSNKVSKVIKKDLQDSLAFELCQLYGSDQGLRETMKLNGALDTLNFIKLVKFVKENGYPNIKLVGEKNAKHECVLSTAGAILLHNYWRLAKEDEHFYLFQNEVKKGRMSGKAFANVLDKYYYANSKNKKNRRVFYGSDWGKPCIQTKEATNKARIEIGLIPLEDKDFVDCGNEEVKMPKART
ncbi:MAG: hypothetical protein ACI7YS_11095 [Flavobacterium sp.]